MTIDKGEVSSKCSGPGTCMIKPGARPLYYAPVCGCDMKTYGNECEAYADGLSVLQKGECDVEG